ncbi:hypothetical protein SDC9_177913 [bioreactor metagenome]|uniref:Uncharacterized protein n=1 Tax=bioreactor metagenome TaxID=1076179 RepID=A0A645GWM2_9ZZZZ
MRVKMDYMQIGISPKNGSYSGKCNKVFASQHKRNFSVRKQIFGIFFDY